MYVTYDHSDLLRQLDAIIEAQKGLYYAQKAIYWAHKELRQGLSKKWTATNDLEYLRSLTQAMRLAYKISDQARAASGFAQSAQRYADEVMRDLLQLAEGACPAE